MGCSVCLCLPALPLTLHLCCYMDASFITPPWLAYPAHVNIVSPDVDSTTEWLFGCSRTVFRICLCLWSFIISLFLCQCDWFYCCPCHLDLVWEACLILLSVALYCEQQNVTVEKLSVLKKNYSLWAAALSFESVQVSKFVDSHSKKKCAVTLDFKYGGFSSLILDIGFSFVKTKCTSIDGCSLLQVLRPWILRVPKNIQQKARRMQNLWRPPYGLMVNEGQV